MDRFAQMAVVAAKQALSDARLDLAAVDRSRIAIVIGTAVGGEQTRDVAAYMTHAKMGRVSPSTIPRVMANAAASGISIEFGITGPALTTSTACASSGHAVAVADSLVRSGVADIAIAGGAETLPAVGLWKAWQVLPVMSAGLMRPFSKERDGFVFGEGAGIVIIESKQHAERRGATVYCELAGTGMSADAGDLVEPAVEGMAAAMRSALAQGGIAPEQVSYINAHGTATRTNDLTETRAIKSVFGTHAQRLVVSSTKAVHGHAMGATSALELVATVMALKDQAAPPTANFLTPDPECDLDYAPNQSRKLPIEAAISNSFAFGGLNVCIALRRVG
jgi:nodulation protein E